MTAPSRAASNIVDRLKQALLGNALPGELDGFDAAEQDDATKLVAKPASGACAWR